MFARDFFTPPFSGADVSGLGMKFSSKLFSLVEKERKKMKEIDMKKKERMKSSELRPLLVLLC
jgi:hypothetical protein